MNSHRIAPFLLLTALLLAPSADIAAKGAGRAFTAKVISIADGDTLTVLDEYDQQHKIRLAGIDMPEKKQAFGTKAREALAAKVFGKEVDVIVIDEDRYGREVGYVYVSGPRHINMEMVREGFAWRYAQYDKRGAFVDAEKDARKHKRGLWADSHPVPPWEFRRQKQRDGR
jgi:endonuclease YncB( thermonuclease family)